MLVIALPSTQEEELNEEALQKRPSNEAESQGKRIFHKPSELPNGRSPTEISHIPWDVRFHPIEFPSQ